MASTHVTHEEMGPSCTNEADELLIVDAGTDGSATLG